jgi:preprotein translocase subunit YajC
MNFPSVLLMMPPDGQGGNGMASMIFLLLIFIVFWFFMIRPQVKKQKAQQKFRESLTKGDRIVTIGGIHGKIIEVQGTTFIIEVEGQNRLKIEKNAVSMESSQALNQKSSK